MAKENQEIALISKIDQKQQLLETVRQSLADLRVENEREKAEKDIEINEKNSQLREKDNELHRKEEEINNLRNQKGLSHEELLNEKLRSEKGNLKLFANELKVSLEKVNNLVKYHERLFIARKTHNRANVDIHEENIAKIEEELRQGEISMVHIQEINRKCERIAEFRWELEQLQQTSSANNNNKVWTNINPNFTPQLVQEWINHGFTYEECADWINIVPVFQQDRAIKEPAYYAWLRDIKKLDAEWVLNQGNERALSLEFFHWYQAQQQNQYQNQQEQSTNNNI